MARGGAASAGLPAERSSFVGRRAELTEVRRLLSASRVVTLVGPGGVGKTRLAVRAATELHRSFPGGTALADLTAVSDPALAVQQVAAAFDVRDTSGRWLPASLADVVGGRQVLLVLDNCEHLRDACAVLVDTLVGACPQLRVLATSRVRLDVEGEALFAVPPLAVPAAGEAGHAVTSDAVALLEQRAAAAVPGLVLGPDDAEDVAELCRRLDGIPLAIELAAGRLRTLTPAELVTRLDDCLGLLRRPGAAVAGRHRTLRATMEWSHDLLGGRERLLWRRAAVFAGDVDLAAAEAVCAGPDLPADEVVDALTSLVEASVVDVVRGPAGPRFRMLQTVRAFGRELLAASGEQAAVRGRHRDWCARSVGEAALDFLGPGQVAAFDRLSADHAELGTALQYCLDTPGEQAAGLELAAELWLWWEARGHLGEGRRWLEVLLAAVPEPSAVRAHGLAVAGYLALVATDPETAGPLLAEARELAGTVGAPAVAALATQYLGQAALFRGDLATADRLLREAFAAHRDQGVPHAAFCLADVGVVALLAGDLAAADEAFAQSLTLGRDGDPWTRSHALWGLGLVRLESGDPAEATLLEERALVLMREVDDRSGTALCVEALAWAAASAGEVDRAARLTGAAEAVWHSIPAELPDPLGRFRDRWAGPARRRLGDQRWATLHAAGRALDRARAVALALRLDGPATAAPGPRGQGTAGGLTARQREVAGLVAQGLTDREIAARLVISPRTAESHVEQILARLGFRSRSQIAAWATGGRDAR
jgi:non-specific serine/threonine protein kinase